MAVSWGLSWGTSWATSWGGIAPFVPTSKGGFDDYRKYRKYLEDLTEATKLKTFNAPIQRIAKEIDKLPVKTPEIKKVIAAKPNVVIDYAKIEREIALIYKYINRMINAYEIEQKLLREQDDEMVLLLAL